MFSAALLSSGFVAVETCGSGFNGSFCATLGVVGVGSIELGLGEFQVHETMSFS